MFLIGSNQVGQVWLKSIKKVDILKQKVIEERARD
jgi:hypothetical protein